MKKFLTVFAIILLLSICFTACEVSSSSTSKQEEVSLAKFNINEYLNISGQYGELERKHSGYSVNYSDFTINIDPAVPGQFYNTSITLKVSLTHGWRVSDSDPAFSEQYGYLFTTIKLPANGSKEETHSLISNLIYDDHNNRDVKIYVESVSGTFIPA